MEKVVANYLHFLKIPVSKKHCTKLILSHPEYPSLLSVVDVLERFGIAYHVSKIEKEELPAIAYPYLLHFTRHGGELTLIRNNQDLKKIGNDFGSWSGVVLQAESKASIADPQNEKAKQEENRLRIASLLLSASMAGLFAMAIFLLFSLFSWLHAALLITAIVGVAVGYLLIAKDMGIKYKAVERFCNAGKRFNCDTIIQAKDATLFGIQKLSDLTISYFIFQLILLCLVGLFPPMAESALWILSAQSVPAVFLVFYSLYYQLVKTNTWCKLCLLVDSILLIQVALLALFYFSHPTPSPELHPLPLLVSFLTFLAIASLVLILKTVIQEKHQNNISEAAANRIKYSISVFSHLLLQEKKVDTSPFAQEFVLGNPDAPLKITLASNLYCNPCKEQHKKIAQLLASYPEKLSVNVRFLLSGADADRKPTSIQYFLQYWLQHIHGTPNASKESEALLHHWFELMDLERFQQRYPLISGAKALESAALEKQHYEWINQSNVSATPTFFINGFQLPDIYTLDDLMTLIPGIAGSFYSPEETQQQETILQNA